MLDLCKLFGVEPEEEFELHNGHATLGGVYKISNNQLQVSTMSTGYELAKMNINCLAKYKVTKITKVTDGEQYEVDRNYNYSSNIPQDNRDN